MKLNLMSCEELTKLARVTPRDSREPILEELLRRDRQLIVVTQHRDYNGDPVRTIVLDGKRSISGGDNIVKHSVLYDLP